MNCQVQDCTSKSARGKCLTCEDSNILCFYHLAIHEDSNHNVTTLSPEEIFKELNILGSLKTSKKKKQTFELVHKLRDQMLQVVTLLMSDIKSISSFYLNILNDHLKNFESVDLQTIEKDAVNKLKATQKLRNLIKTVFQNQNNFQSLELLIDPCIICHKKETNLIDHGTHSICEKCSDLFPAGCYFCQCFSCKASQPTITRNECGHPCCRDCSERRCEICYQPCSLCQNVEILNQRNCKNHGFCEACIKKFMKYSDCFICFKNRDKNECFRCQRPLEGIQRVCDSDHFYCDDCKTFKICRCERCEECKKILECSYCYQRIHKVCASCSTQDSCRICEKIKEFRVVRHFF